MHWIFRNLRASCIWPFLSEGASQDSRYCKKGRIGGPEFFIFKQLVLDRGDDSQKFLAVRNHPSPYCP